MEVDTMNVLQEAEKRYEPQVITSENMSFDLGNLLAFDAKPVDAQRLKQNPESLLQTVARDGLQLLINKIFALPTQRVVDGVLAQLPSPILPIPREKHVPEPKPPTRWEKFAKEKGIVKRKRERFVEDEEGVERRRYGYKSKDHMQDWVIEAKEGEDPFADPYAAKAKDKREKLEKQEENRQKNKKFAQRMQNKNLPGTIMISTGFKKKEKRDIDKAVEAAHKSTISIGKFNELLPKEKKHKSRQKPSEKERNLKLLGTVLKNTPELQETKAVNRFNEEERARKKRKH